MTSSDLVVVSTFRSTADAQLARHVLERAGIDSMIRADDAGGMYPSMRVVELLVRSEDARKAERTLNPR